jgi:predicted nucleotidyltransferase
MAELKGENLLNRFKPIAERLVSEISAVNCVSGVILLGGLARGFMDKFSDVDITVLLETSSSTLKQHVRRICAKEQSNGLDLDLELYSLADFKVKVWDDMDRWEYSHAKIAFDPEGKTRKAIAEKLIVHKNFWTERIAADVEHIKWYCCPLDESVGTISEAWVERGNLTAAHYCLNNVSEVMLEMAFALNRKFLPSPKWRLYYFYRLQGLPEGFKEDLDEALKVGSLSLEEFRRRLRILRVMWNKIKPLVEKETNLTTAQLHTIYVQNILQQ